MKRAFLNLRYSMPERVARFQRGLQRLGYHCFPATPRSSADLRQTDLFVTWNRIREGHDWARRFDQIGARVVVTENATWGNTFAGEEWLTLTRSWHNQRGCFPIGGPERWDCLGVPLEPWRKGGETVLLPQRGIGPPGMAMPIGWAAQYKREGRTRMHPGTGRCVPLREDLAQAGLVRTWGSGAAVLACIWGIPVKSDMPDWIGEQNNNDADRLRMLRELAWAQSRVSEIESGEALARIIE